MRKVTNYSVKKESFEDMYEAKRFNPCLEMTFRDKGGVHTHKLSAGHGDDIYVYREHGMTFVLTNNNYLGYVGLEVFSVNEIVVHMFLEYHQVIEVLGKCDLAPFTMIRRLKECICQ